MFVHQFRRLQKLWWTLMADSKWCLMHTHIHKHIIYRFMSSNHHVRGLFTRTLTRGYVGVQWWLTLSLKAYWTQKHCTLVHNLTRKEFYISKISRQQLFYLSLQRWPRKQQNSAVHIEKYLSCIWWDNAVPCCFTLHCVVLCFFPSSVTAWHQI